MKQAEVHFSVSILTRSRSFAGVFDEETPAGSRCYDGRLIVMTAELLADAP